MASIWYALPAFLWQWISFCKPCAFSFIHPAFCCARWSSHYVSDSVSDWTTRLHKWWSYTIQCPDTFTLCYDFNLLRNTLSFASKTRHWFLSHHLTRPISTECTQCNHRPQGDEFIDIILQYPARSSENCLHFDKTTGRRDLQSYHKPPLTLLWLILQGPPLKCPESWPFMGRFSLGWAGSIWKKWEMVWRVPLFQSSDLDGFS